MPFQHLEYFGAALCQFQDGVALAVFYVCAGVCFEEVFHYFGNTMSNGLKERGFTMRVDDVHVGTVT